MSDFTAAACSQLLSGSYFVLSPVQMTMFLIVSACVGAIISSNIVNWYWRNK